MIRENQFKSYANYQDLLKTIAVIAFIIDHLGLFEFIPDNDLWTRAIGRCVTPIFCFYVGYNFTKPKHIIGFLGIILTFMVYKCFGYINTMLNVLIMIYLGQWYLLFMQKLKCDSELSALIQCVTLLLLSLITHNYLDYGTLGMAFMVVGKLAKQGRPFKIFLPLLGACTMILVIAYFGYYFSIADIVLANTVTLCTCLALYKSNHNAQIPIDLRIISRHTLLIYFINFGGHLAWFYYKNYGLLLV